MTINRPSRRVAHDLAHSRIGADQRTKRSGGQVLPRRRRGSPAHLRVLQDLPGVRVKPLHDLGRHRRAPEKVQPQRASPGTASATRARPGDPASAPASSPRAPNDRFDVGVADAGERHLRLPDNRSSIAGHSLCRAHGSSTPTMAFEERARRSCLRASVALLRRSSIFPSCAFRRDEGSRTEATSSWDSPPARRAGCNPARRARSPSSTSSGTLLSSRGDHVTPSMKSGRVTIRFDFGDQALTYSTARAPGPVLDERPPTGAMDGRGTTIRPARLRTRPAERHHDAHQRLGSGYFRA